MLQEYRYCDGDLVDKLVGLHCLLERCLCDMFSDM